MLNRLSCKISSIPVQEWGTNYPASRRSIRIRGSHPVERKLPKQLRRSYNRLRLYLISHRYYELMALGMQPELLYPRRSRFAPIWLKRDRFKCRR